MPLKVFFVHKIGGGAMVLGLPVLGVLLISIIVGQGPTALTVGTHIGLLVVLGLNGPLRQYFSLYRAVSQREEDERKNVQTTPTRTYCKRNRPLPY